MLKMVCNEVRLIITTYVFIIVNILILKMAAISLNYKTYPYIALVIGYYADDFSVLIC